VSGPTAPPRRRHRRVRIVAAIVAVVLVGAIATFVVLWNRVTTRPVSIAEAGRRAGAAGYGTDQSATATPLRPAAGIYQYRGEGTEKLDKPPRSQSQGPGIPGTVTHLGGRCWKFRVDYNTNHWQSWDYCSTGKGLTEQGGSFFQRLDLVITKVETSSTYTCDPPADTIRAAQRVGDQWKQNCHGTSTTASGEVIAAGPYRYLGQEDLDIGGKRVKALHYQWSRTLTGGQNGTEAGDFWFDAETGLPLRNRRVVTVHSDSPIGRVTYDERGSFVLVSMTPTR
jgi:hypothetical protein